MIGVGINVMGMTVAVTSGTRSNRSIIRVKVTSLHVTNVWKDRRTLQDNDFDSPVAISLNDKDITAYHVYPGALPST